MTDRQVQPGIGRVNSNSAPMDKCGPGRAPSRRQVRHGDGQIQKRVAKLRIALVTTFFPPYNFGGDGMYIERFARSLVSHGHEVEVIHDTDGYRVLSGTDPDPAPRIEKDGFTVHRLRSRSPLLSSLAIQQTGRPASHGVRLKKLLADRFDVIHYHNISLVGGPGAWAMGSGIKLHTAHEHWLVCPTHVLWRHDRELCDGRECLRCSMNYRRPPQLWRSTGLIDRMARHVDAFLTFSQSAADNHRRFGFRHPMRVVPSFLPDAPPLSEQTPPEATRPFFLCVGRLEKIKGFDQVIRAMKNRPTDLLIAGTGDEETALRETAKGLENVIFLGRKTPDELRLLYRDALALVTPSRCYEVFPLVVLEAFREGTPIVARNLGPFPEIVDATSAGLLFDNDRDLGRALDRMTDDTAMRSEMGLHASRSFDSKWSEKVALQSYFDLISEIGTRDTAAGRHK